MPVAISSISSVFHEPASFPATFGSKLLENIKVSLRANRYRTREDRGGISYLFNSVRAGETIFDIGAHKGGYLYYMHRLAGKNGKVVAFEPQHSLFNYLKKTKALLDWSNITVEPYAVSNSQGDATLYIPYNHGKNSAPGATIVEQVLKEEVQRTETVDTISLDLYCMCNNITPSFLKIDVEGNELNVFLGAQQLLKSAKPRILFECEARHIGKEQLFETFHLLHQLGYCGRFICDDKFLPVSVFNIEQFQTPGAGVYCNNFIFE